MNSDGPQQPNDAELRRRIAELESQLEELDRSGGSTTAHGDQPEPTRDEPGETATIFMMAVGLIGLPVAFGYLGPADSWAGWSVPERVVVVCLFVAAWFGGVFLGRRFDEELHKEKSSFPEN